ncbi:MAG: DMT family transporter [Candidatus Hodarchaeales archaeon]
MVEERKKEVIYGPTIVAAANGMRAFDAPARYPYLFSYFPWGNTSVESALKFSGFSSFVVFIEHFIGFLLLVPIIMFIRGPKHLFNQAKKFQLKEWLSILLISIGSGLGLYFFLIAFTVGNPTVAILLQKFQPIITLLVAMLLLKERPTRFYYIAALLAMVGVILLVFNDLTDPDRVFFDIIAAIASLIAAALWGANTVWGRMMTEKIDYWDLTAYRYIGGTVVLAVFNLIAFAYTPENIDSLFQTYTTFATMGENPALLPLNIPVMGIIIIIYATIFTGGIIPLAIYYYGLKWSKASISGLAELSFPVLAVFVNFIFLGWMLNITQIIGAIIILVVISALSYINAKEHEKKEKKSVVSSSDE